MGCIVGGRNSTLSATPKPKTYCGMQLSRMIVPGKQNALSTQHSPAVVHCALELQIRPPPRQSTQVMVSSPASHMPFMLQAPEAGQSAAQLVTSSPMPGSQVPLLLHMPLFGQSRHAGVKFISPASQVPLLLHVTGPPQSTEQLPISLVEHVPSPQRAGAESICRAASGVGSPEPFPHATKAPAAKQTDRNDVPTNTFMTG